ncbi:secreted aspartyl protease [Phycomyces blakesleeanus]|uniref:Secreted aspartyl protease n=2 Tax=Phycomyces blakesleeanus TaxID=4837 RepID=A0A162TVN3_PHYB8|nr:secreted aspartyl protease [Phycomyces blakesleeanus NRRL 1555(-)]OAD71352.1 secreted aspartyl protease [Phycomyces blakesleeanus NRRL 1555(-)]|eukprot:XP_018289392.1 secreted aspartyl protease [Phycomyces blakesleeanus NRRL 1555(-)]
MRYSTFFIAAIAPLLLSVTADPTPVKIPLFRRTNPANQTGITKAAGYQLDNGALSGTVKIGTPPQEFTVAFDTTTGYSWIRGSRCKSENCLDRCTYYARRSSTVTSTGEKFSVEYGDSCVDTHVYLDTFEFAGLTVHDMPFGGAYRMSGFDDGFDGYLGLGRSVNFNSTKLHTSSSTGLAKRDVALPASAFVPNAYQQGSGVQSSQFGMYTTSTSDDGFSQSGTGTSATESDTTTDNSTAATATTSADAAATSSSSSSGVVSGGFGFVKRNYHPQTQVAGYLVIGGVDTSAISGDVEYIPLANTGDADAHGWDVCIRDANFDNELNMKQLPNAIASISTSSQFIVMPPHQADKFHDTFGGRYHASDKTYRFVCCEAEKLPTLKLTLEDHIVELPAKYWVHRENATDCCGYCTTRLSRGNSERDWVLGTTFTNAFYTTFDSDGERIGLALKKDHKDDGLRVYKKSH